MTDIEHDSALVKRDVADQRAGTMVPSESSLALRTSAGTGFCAPTLNELYRPFQVGTILTAANEALVAERLVGAEAGVEIAPVDALTARVTGFRNRLENPVTNVTLPAPLPGGAVRQRQNLGAAQIQGLEASVQARFARRWTGLVAYSEVRVIGPQFEDDLNTLPMGGFLVVNLSVSRRLWRGLEVFGAIENLLDRRYLVGRAGIDTYGQPLTGRIGLRVR